MRSYREVSYEEVENVFDEAYLTETYEKGNAFSFVKRVVVGVFFSFGAIAPGLFSRMIIKDFSSSPMPLDLKNLYQYLIPSTSIILILGLLIYLCFERVAKQYIGKNNIKYSYKLSFWLECVVGVCLYFSIVFSQLLIESRFMRIIYTILILSSLIYNVRKGIKLGLSIGSDQKFEDKVGNFLSQNKPKLVMILFALWASNVVLRMFRTQHGNLFVVIAPILPLVITLGLFLLPILFESHMKMYYLNKYSENFRQKFNVPEELWYGKNNQLLNQQE